MATQPTPAANPARAASHPVADVAGEPPPLSVYQTVWRERRDAPWQPGLPLSLGFAWDASHQIPQPIVQLADQDVTSQTVLTVDTNHCLVLSIDLHQSSSILCELAPSLYLVCSAVLSADGLSFSGQIGRLCSGPVQREWSGKTELLASDWMRARRCWIETTLARSNRRQQP